MLEFGRLVAFRMDVCDFLDLECALQGRRIEDAAPDEEHVVGLGVFLGYLSNLIRLLQHLGNEVGDALDFGNQLDALLQG